MSNSEIRVRFAPSPTGAPHVGNMRTALFNWLFARHHGGKFIVRIEDTDTDREVPGAVDAILDGLRWLGLDWDEGPKVGGDYEPYFQSERLELYHEVAEELVKKGAAYYCYCSEERLAEMRAEQTKNKQPPGYDRKCRELSNEARAKYEEQGITPVIRFKTPLSGETRFHDLIREDVVFDNATLDDFVLLKSDGYPTYHLANIVDDHKMEISHVLRAEEWLSSTPRHLLLYHAMGYEPPLFAHLPMILGPDRSKLSKRHGAVSITEYYIEGYLPQTMVNFMALLGWSLDDKTEIISREDLVKHFSLERISRTSAIFDKRKLNWMNGLYIRKLTPAEFYEAAHPFMIRDDVIGRAVVLREDYVRQVLPLIHERVKTMAEIPDLIRFFFEDELDYEPERLIPEDVERDRIVQALKASSEKLEKAGPFEAKTLEEVFRALASELQLKTGELFGALRTALTGQEVAPPLFTTMAVLGREKCLERVSAATEKLGREY